VASLDGIILDINDDFSALFQSTRDALIGRSVIGLGLYPNQRVYSQMIDHLLNTGKTHAQEIAFRDFAGAAHWTQLYTRSIETDGKVYLLILMHDVSAHHEVEEALKQSEARYQVLLAQAERSALEANLINQIRNLVARQVDLQDVIRTVVEGVATVFGYPLVSLYLSEDGFSILQHQVGYKNILPRIPVTIGVLGRVIRTGKPILLRDTSEDPDFLGG